MVSQSSVVYDIVSCMQTHCPSLIVHDILSLFCSTLPSAIFNVQSRSFFLSSKRALKVDRAISFILLLPYNFDKAMTKEEADEVTKEYWH